MMIRSEKRRAGGSIGPPMTRLLCWLGIREQEPPGGRGGLERGALLFFSVYFLFFTGIKPHDLAFSSLLSFLLLFCLL